MKNILKSKFALNIVTVTYCVIAVTGCSSDDSKLGGSRSRQKRFVYNKNRCNGRLRNRFNKETIKMSHNNSNPSTSKTKNQDTPSNDNSSSVLGIAIIAAVVIGVGVNIGHRYYKNGGNGGNGGNSNDSGNGGKKQLFKTRNDVNNSNNTNTNTNNNNGDNDEKQPPIEVIPKNVTMEDLLRIITNEKGDLKSEDPIKALHKSYNKAKIGDSLSLLTYQKNKHAKNDQDILNANLKKICWIEGKIPLLHLLNLVGWIVYLRAEEFGDDTIRAMLRDYNQHGEYDGSCNIYGGKISDLNKENRVFYKTGSKDTNIQCTICPFAFKGKPIGEHKKYQNSFMPLNEVDRFILHVKNGIKDENEEKEFAKNRSNYKKKQEKQEKQEKLLAEKKAQQKADEEELKNKKIEINKFKQQIDFDNIMVNKAIVVKIKEELIAIRASMKNSKVPHNIGFSKNNKLYTIVELITAIIKSTHSGIIFENIDVITDFNNLIERVSGVIDNIDSINRYIDKEQYDQAKKILTKLFKKLSKGEHVKYLNNIYEKIQEHHETIKFICDFYDFSEKVCSEISEIIENNKYQNKDKLTKYCKSIKYKKDTYKNILYKDWEDLKKQFHLLKYYNNNRSVKGCVSEFKSVLNQYMRTN